MCSEGFTGFYLTIAGNICGEAEIRCVDHSCHRLRAEVMIKSAVIPDYPELILVRYLIAKLLAACDVLSDNSVELLAVEVDSLAEIHLVIDNLQYRLLVAALVLKVCHCGSFQLFCRKTALVEFTSLAYRHCKADILLLCTVNERRIDRCMRCK